MRIKKKKKSSKPKPTNCGKEPEPEPEDLLLKKKKEEKKRKKEKRNIKSTRKKRTKSGWWQFCHLPSNRHDYARFLSTPKRQVLCGLGGKCLGHSQKFSLFPFLANNT